ncbi:MAG: tetratricopeptide repeat protein [Pseudomonadota bacterium]
MSIDDEDRDAALQEAARAIAQGRPDDAVVLLEQLVGAGVRSGRAFGLLGVARHRSGRSAQAREAFLGGLSAAPDDADLHNNYGVFLKQTGAYEEAIAALAEARRLNPANRSVNLNLGNCYLALGRWRDAEAALDAATSAAPQNPMAWNSLGVVRKRMGDFSGALVAYARALELAPDAAPVRRNYAACLAAAGDTRDAIAALRAVQNTQPDYWPARNDLAGLLEKQGDLDEAIALFEGVAAAAPERAEPHANLAGALLAAGRAREALDATDAALAASGEKTTALALRSVAFSVLNDPDAFGTLVETSRLVRQYDAPPDAFAQATGETAVADFNRMLTDSVRAHPSLTFEPAGLTTRQGRQTRELLDGAPGPFAVLATWIERCVDDYIAALDPQRDALFLSGLPERRTLTMWGTILDPGGRLEPHIHAPNWLSGVYYPKLPPATPDEPTAGWFEVGRPPAHYHTDPAAPPALFQPAEGRLFLFPSFFYHRTTPFSVDERVSIAFDVEPLD